MIGRGVGSGLQGPGPQELRVARDLEPHPQRRGVGPEGCSSAYDDQVDPPGANRTHLAERTSHASYACRPPGLQGAGGVFVVRCPPHGRYGGSPRRQRPTRGAGIERVRRGPTIQQPGLDLAERPTAAVGERANGMRCAILGQRRRPCGKTAALGRAFTPGRAHCKPQQQAEERRESSRSPNHLDLRPFRCTGGRHEASPLLSKHQGVAVLLYRNHRRNRLREYDGQVRKLRPGSDRVLFWTTRDALSTDGEDQGALEW
jgi:hypothetical protein